MRLRCFTAAIVVPLVLAAAVATAAPPPASTAASGTLTFAPGERAKTIPISVVGDTSIEPDETFTVMLSGAVNARIATGIGTETIKNDDTAVPLTAGSYKGATQNGNYVFFT